MRTPILLLLCLVLWRRAYGLPQAGNAFGEAVDKLNKLGLPMRHMKAARSHDDSTVVQQARGVAAPQNYATLRPPRGRPPLVVPPNFRAGVGIPSQKPPIVANYRGSNQPLYPQTVYQTTYRPPNYGTPVYPIVPSGSYPAPGPYSTQGPYPSPGPSYTTLGPYPTPSTSPTGGPSTLSEPTPTTPPTIISTPSTSRGTQPTLSTTKPTPSTPATVTPTVSTSSTTKPTPSTLSTAKPTPSTPSTAKPSPSTPSTAKSTPSTPSTTRSTPSTVSTTKSTPSTPSTPSTGSTTRSTPATPTTPSTTTGTLTPTKDPDFKTTFETSSSTTRSTRATTPGVIINRIRGKPHVICKDDGIIFTATTVFPFVGEVFTRNQKNNPSCYKKYTGQDRNIRLVLNYEECGRPAEAIKPTESNYTVEVVVSYENDDGSSTLQSFLLRCHNQRIVYATDQVPQQIEEALEELNLVPIKLEKKAPLPDCVMRIVPESEEDAHSYGPSDKKPVSDATIGQKLRIEWSLDRNSNAYGFLVKNCTVVDKVSGNEYLVIDENGCSTDINILGHPHYDVYHDLAIVHWHAFKVPDNVMLSIRCGFQICSDIEDDLGVTGCEQLPTPPFCPDIVTAAPNSLLFDFERRFDAQRQLEELKVAADICIVDENTGALPETCEQESVFRRRQMESSMSRFNKAQSASESWIRRRTCVSGTAFASLLSFTVLMFALSIGAYVASSTLERRRRSGGALAKLRPTDGSDQYWYASSDSAPSVDTASTAAMFAMTSPQRFFADSESVSSQSVSSLSTEIKCRIAPHCR